MGWYTPLGSTLVGFIFLALDKIGRDLEDPFENTIYDVPLTSITTTIEINLRQLLGETALPEAAEAGAWGALVGLRASPELEPLQFAEEVEEDDGGEDGDAADPLGAIGGVLEGQALEVHAVDAGDGEGGQWRWCRGR